MVRGAFPASSASDAFTMSLPSSLTDTTTPSRFLRSPSVTSTLSPSLKLVHRRSGLFNIQALNGEVPHKVAVLVPVGSVAAQVVGKASGSLLAPALLYHQAVPLRFSP
ncbi:MAG: hypothetical protein FRX49_12753 [Trebouxia sp. A1-2]|nr:MAG: hypothetical protein FRX49_12753 [Trebouxia sp. A1-2]